MVKDERHVEFSDLVSPAALFASRNFDKYMPMNDKGKVVFAEIKPTYRCNQFCPFCIWESRKKIDNMSKNEIKANLSYIADVLQPSCIILSGGEPTILPTKEFILSSISEIESVREFHLHTNATNISKIDYSLLEAVASKRSASIGIHGHNKEIHESITGVSRSFDRVLKGITILHDAGYSLRAAVILCKQNFESINEITEFLLSNDFDAVELRLPFLGIGIKPESIFVKYDRLESILACWMESFIENSKVLLLASGALCFGKIPLNSYINDNEFHFFDKLHQLGAHSISHSQIISVWPDVYKDYRKISKCKQCVFDIFCTGFSPSEVCFGYARYRPTTLTDLVK